MVFNSTGSTCSNEDGCKQNECKQLIFRSSKDVKVSYLKFREPYKPCQEIETHFVKSASSTGARHLKYFLAQQQQQQQNQTIKNILSTFAHARLLHTFL